MINIDRNGDAGELKVRLVIQAGDVEIMFAPEAVKGLTPLVSLEIAHFLAFIALKVPLPVIMEVFEQLPNVAKKQFKIRKKSNVLLPK